MWNAEVRRQPCLVNRARRVLFSFLPSDTPLSPGGHGTRKNDSVCVASSQEGKIGSRRAAVKEVRNIGRTVRRFVCLTPPRVEVG